MKRPLAPALLPLCLASVFLLALVFSLPYALKSQRAVAVSPPLRQPFVARDGAATSDKGQRSEASGALLDLAAVRPGDPMTPTSQIRTHVRRRLPNGPIERHEAETAFSAAEEVEGTALLPGEFEKQGGVLISGQGLLGEYSDVFVDIVSKAREASDVFVLVSDREDLDEVGALLQELGLSASSVKFIEVPHETIWVRDYGPLTVTLAIGGNAVLDPMYSNGGELDDAVPHELAQQLGLPLIPLPLQLEGGNLLSNGRGLCITTTALLDHNQALEYQEDDIRTFLREYCGCQETVFLEPLVGEDTRHVDMFATFTSPSTLVVGSYERDGDPLNVLNAGILDDNAHRLARLSAGSLRIVRIPMPPSMGSLCRTYTNVVYCNGILLVPSYPTVERRLEQRAFDLYARLLPRWKILGVDSEGLITKQGALHCIAMNMARR